MSEIKKFGTVLSFSNEQLKEGREWVLQHLFPRKELTRTEVPVSENTWAKWRRIKALFEEIEASGYLDAEELEFTEPQPDWDVTYAETYGEWLERAEREYKERFGD